MALSLQPPSTSDAVPEWRGEQPAGGLSQTDAARGLAGGRQPASPSPIGRPAHQVCRLPCVLILSFFLHLYFGVLFCFPSLDVLFCFLLVFIPHFLCWCGGLWWEVGT